MNLDLEEQHRRHLTIANFVNSAIGGNAAKLKATIPALDWPGAWRLTFENVVKIGAVHPAARDAFKSYWRDFLDEPGKALRSDLPSIWPLTRDLDGYPTLLADGLRLLLPAAPARPAPAPVALFRGGRLSEHGEGRHGCWWTPDPTFAEMFARMRSCSTVGLGQVVMAVDPGDAIVVQLDALQFLLDPTRLVDVVSVALLPTYTPGEEAVVEFSVGLLAGVPWGWDHDGLDEWLALNRPRDGLARYREERQRAAEWCRQHCA